MKTKVEAVSGLDTGVITSHLEARLKGATREQLATAVCALSENIVEITADCPDDNTHLSLAAEIVCSILDRHNDALKNKPVNDSVNGKYVSQISTVFGNKGRLNQSHKDRRQKKIERWIGLGIDNL